MNIDNNLRHLLENETKIHLAEIRFSTRSSTDSLGLMVQGFPSPLALIQTGSVPILLKPPLMVRAFIFRCCSSATV